MTRGELRDLILKFDKSYQTTAFLEKWGGKLWQLIRRNRWSSKEGNERTYLDMA